MRGETSCGSQAVGHASCSKPRALPSHTASSRNWAEAMLGLCRPCMDGNAHGFTAALQNQAVQSAWSDKEPLLHRITSAGSRDTGCVADSHTSHGSEGAHCSLAPMLLGDHGAPTCKYQWQAGMPSLSRAVEPCDRNKELPFYSLELMLLHTIPNFCRSASNRGLLKPQGQA